MTNMVTKQGEINFLQYNKYKLKTVCLATNHMIIKYLGK